jgi:hypothetical protein
MAPAIELTGWTMINLKIRLSAHCWNVEERANLKTFSYVEFRFKVV